jgi:internalin A
MGEVLKIFISATSADLGAVRRAARDYFNNLTDEYKAREQENRDSFPATLVENDRRHLTECHAVLHIVGECYGEDPEDGAEPAEGGGGAEPGGQRAVVAGAGGRGGDLRTGGGGEGRGEGSRRSYTQREYDYAIEHEKPLYLFLCEESFPYTAHQPESEEKQALQRAHRKAIEAGKHWYWRIANRADLDAALGEIKLAPQLTEVELRDTRERFDEVRRDVAGLRAGITAIDPLQRYYQNLREQFANYDNVGLPVTAREGKEEKEEPIKIRDLFVPPHCSTQHIRPAELDAAVREGRMLGEPLLPLLEKPGARIVLLADPGMGKSTVIQYLIATLADGKAPVGAPGLRGAIPFPFILRELARLLPDDVKQWNWDALLDAFCRWDPRSGGEGAIAAPIAEHATFRTLIGSKNAFFLIDGLDEIGDPVKRVAMRDAILESFNACRNSRWLITSRIVGYERAEVHRSDAQATFIDRPVGAKTIDREIVESGAINGTAEWLGGPVKLLFAHLHYLAPFNDTQQRAFAEHWYMPRMGEGKGAGRAREFVAAVHQHPHTRVIGRIPNLLYLLALLYRHQAQLPHGRALVYEAISEAYLESIPLQRLLLGEAAAYSQSFPVKEQLLAIVGMKMQQMRASRKEGEDGDILVSPEQLSEWLAGRFDSEAALQEFLDHVARHSGLLLPRGEGVYGFAHLSFQEYYAACHLWSDFERIVTAARPAGFLRKATPAAGENEERLFAEYAKQPVWHEPLLFLVEKIRGNKDFTAQLLEWMFPQLADDPGKGEDWMPWPAAHLLATLSVDPEVQLEKDQRDSIWQALWKADVAVGASHWRIASSLVVAGSGFQSGVLQAAAAIRPQRLSLWQCSALNDLTPLAGLTGLQSLHLGPCSELSDIYPLGGMTELTELYLDDCTAVSDLTPIAGLSRLQKLLVSGSTGLSDLSPLAGLVGLRELQVITCTALSELTPLAGLIALETLSLRDCPAICDISRLAGLSGLKKLFLGGCTALEDLTPLIALLALETLGLRDQEARSDFSLLAKLTRLQWLFLQNCTLLSDLTPLAALTDLQHLVLSGCIGMRDLTPLSGLTGLRWLDLRDCTALRDLHPLAGLTGLRHLILKGSGLSEEEVEKLRKALPETDIST